MKIDEMYAFVAVDEDGDEGIMSMLTKMGWMPMVGADMARIDAIRPHVDEIAQESGITVRLLRFSTREELEIINP